MLEARTRFIKNQLMENAQTTRLQNKKRKEIQAMMLPIYSRQRGHYQMDTWEQSDDVKALHQTIRGGRRGANRDMLELQERHKDDYPPYFLIIINVNTRYAYAYPMETKDAHSVKTALARWTQELHLSTGRAGMSANEIYTDDDPAYRGLEQWLGGGIKHVVTNSENHHTLGIVNRFIRTIRDKYPHKRDLSVQEMERLSESTTNVAMERPVNVLRIWIEMRTRRKNIS